MSNTTNLDLSSVIFKLKPLHDRVIVKRNEVKDKTESGIILASNAKEFPDQGEVLAVGLGKRHDDGQYCPMSVKVGDTVLFGKYAGQPVKIENVEYLVMREEDLMAVLK